MSIVTLSRKFQVVIPRRIRETLGLKPGQKIEAIQYLDRVEFIPVRSPRAMRGCTADAKHAAGGRSPAAHGYASTRTNCPGRTVAIAVNPAGTRGSRSSSALLAAQSTTTPRRRFEIFC